MSTSFDSTYIFSYIKTSDDNTHFWNMALIKAVVSQKPTVEITTFSTYKIIFFFSKNRKKILLCFFLTGKSFSRLFPWVS